MTVLQGLFVLVCFLGVAFGHGLCGCKPDITFCASNGKTYSSICELKCDLDTNPGYPVYYGPCRNDPYNPYPPLPYIPVPPQPQPYIPVPLPQPYIPVPPHPQPYIPVAQQSYLGSSPSKSYLVSSPSQSYLGSSPSQSYLGSSPSQSYLGSSPQSESSAPGSKGAYY